MLLFLPFYLRLDGGELPTSYSLLPEFLFRKMLECSPTFTHEIFPVIFSNISRGSLEFDRFPTPDYIST